MSYIATVAGVYTVTIKHSAESDHIYGSPFRNLMVAVGATDASSTAATGAALTAAVAGVESTFYLQTYDAASNARTVGGDTWTITMTKGATTVSVQVVDANDGSYTASYNATVSGTYALVVKVNGVSLSSSPYTLVVSPATAAASTSTFPLGVSSPTAGVLSSFVIQAFDAFSNAHTVGNHDFFVQLYVSTSIVVVVLTVLAASTGAATSFAAMSPTTRAAITQCSIPSHPPATTPSASSSRPVSPSSSCSCWRSSTQRLQV